MKSFQDPHFMMKVKTILRTLNSSNEGEEGNEGSPLPSKMNTADHENCSHCNTADFLPFRCRFCSLLFCSDHALGVQHGCSSLAGKEDKSKSPVLAPVSLGGNSLKDSETVQSIFDAVERRHENLFSDGDGMTKVHNSTTGIKTTQSAILKSVTDSNLDSLNKIKKLEEIQTTGSAREASIALKTRDLLLKGKAVGMHKDIQNDDRFYFIATFASDKEFSRKCFYCNSHTATIGELCEWIARTQSMLCFKKVMRPEGQSVYFSVLAAEQEALDDNATESSPRYAEFDRRMLVSKALTPMQEVRFHAISSSAAAAAQVVLASKADEAAAELARQELIAAAAKQAAAAEAAKPKPLDIQSVAVGDVVLYVKDDIVHVAEIKCVHRDDFPNLYFTIAYEEPGGKTFEKQTTGKYLAALLAEEVSPQAGGFAVNIVHGSKTIKINGVGRLMTVSVLKALVQRHTDVPPRNQKLICKGTILQDSELIKDTKITPLCKISLMASKK